MAAKGTGVEPPIPRPAIAQLEKLLGRSLEGWDVCPPRHSSPSPGLGVEGAWFDVEEAARTVRQLRDMPHTAGRRWAGHPFEADPWQVVWIIAPVFGWKGPDGTRIVREVWDEIPRKNGKTTLSARLGIKLLAGDGELGAEVYAAAGSRDQAGFMLKPAKDVATRSPRLRRRLQVLTSLIRHPSSGSFFRVLSKAGDLAHGANVHGGLIDEIHVHKDRGLIDAIESGTGARDQPLIIYTTTADEGDDNTIYGELHKRALGLATGDLVDPSTYVVIWCADRDADPFDEATIRAANPGYPNAPTADFIARKILKAQQTPSYLPTFKRLYLNIRAAEVGRRPEWDWADSAGMVDEAKLKGRPCWGGLVTRSAQDLTALCWTFRSPDKDDEWWAVWRHFLPEDRFRSLLERTNQGAEVWRNEGRLILTEGNVIDVGRHLAQIREDAKRFDVRQLAYDPNGAIGIVSHLAEADEMKTIPIYANTPSTAMADWEGLVRARKYVHGMNPVMAWQMQSNLMLKETTGGVTKIDPKASHDVVPGVVAAEMALRRALLDVEGEPGSMVLTYR